MRSEKRLKNRTRQVVFVCFCSIIIALVLAGCGNGLANDVSSTPTPIPFVPLQLEIPQKALMAPIMGDVPDSQPLHVGITLKISQQALDQMAGSGIVSSNGTQTANNIAEKLGISDADYQRLKQFFGLKDATLTLSETHTSMTLDIKAGALAQVLQTKFVQHQLDHRTFYTPDPQHMPKIPASIATVILAVTGLDNYSQPPTSGLHLDQKSIASKQAKQATQARANCGPTNTVSWSRLAHAYGYDQLWHLGRHGENMTINLVEIDGANLSDLQAYFACAGFKGTVDFTTIDGPAPAPGPESTLDIEMIAGLAPAAHIKVYQTDISKGTQGDDGWSNLSDTLQRIIDDNAAHPNAGSAVSISLGASEDYVTGGVAKAIGQRLQLLTRAEHMTVYVASGDCGAYASRTFSTLSTSYPASDPWAVSVGGTQIALDNQSNRANEIAWTGVPMSSSCSYNEWGSGGGVSKLFKKPDWQQGPGVKNHYSNGFRQLPDIAAVADDLPIFFNGKWQSAAGTSAATPIWAAGMALVNQRLIATKKLYAYGPSTFYLINTNAGNAKPYFDEVEGTNWYYVATPGWDYTTGLGSPNLPEVYQVIYNKATA